MNQKKPGLIAYPFKNLPAGVARLVFNPRKENPIYAIYSPKMTPQQIATAINAELDRYRRNSEATAEIRRIIGKQNALHAVYAIKPLVDYWEQRGDDIGAIECVDLFNFGYIEGVRAERAKRKRGTQHEN